MGIQNVVHNFITIMFDKKVVLPILVFAVFLVQVYAVPIQHQTLQPQQMKTNTEIEDLILEKKSSEAEFVNPYNHHDDDDNGSIALDDRFKYDVEILESGDNSHEIESEFEERFQGNALNMNLGMIFPEDIEVAAMPSVQQYRVVTFVLIGLVAVTLFVAGSVWRRNLHKRYGNRLLLTTKPDNDDNYIQDNTAPSL